MSMMNSFENMNYNFNYNNTNSGMDMRMNNVASNDFPAMSQFNNYNNQQNSMYQMQSSSVYPTAMSETFNQSQLSLELQLQMIQAQLLQMEQQQQVLNRQQQQQQQLPYSLPTSMGQVQQQQPQSLPEPKQSSNNREASTNNSEDDGTNSAGGKTTKTNCRAIHFTLEQVSEYFHLPISQAARELGVCTTVVKKVCRRHGINRWPQRKLCSLGKHIKSLQDASYGIVKVESGVPSIKMLIGANTNQQQKNWSSSANASEPSALKMDILEELPMMPQWNNLPKSSSQFGLEM